MNTLKLNSAGLNRVTLNTIGEVTKKKTEESGGGLKPSDAPNGVYIQHIKGGLYTTDEWTAAGYASDKANGVAVVTNKCRFVMAVNYAASARWSNLDSVLIEGVFNTEEQQTAKTDFGGRQNSVKIAEASESSAAQICLEYTFKNGQKGYLPALGELEQLHSVSGEVNTALKALGGSYRSTDMWSSTQRGEDRAWVNGYRYVNSPKGYKSDYNKTWPFTELK